MSLCCILKQWQNKIIIFQQFFFFSFVNCNSRWQICNCLFVPFFPNWCSALKKTIQRKASGSEWSSCRILFGQLLSAMFAKIAGQCRVEIREKECKCTTTMIMSHDSKCPLASLECSRRGALSVFNVNGHQRQIRTKRKSDIFQQVPDFYWNQDCRLHLYFPVRMRPWEGCMNMNNQYIHYGVTTCANI